MMMNTRSRMRGSLAVFPAITLVAAMTIPTMADAGPVARGAARGAMGGAFVSGVTGGDALAGAAVGAATGAVVAKVRKDRRRR